MNAHEFGSKSLKMIVILSGTGRSQYSSNGYSTTHHVLYENNTLNKDLPTTPTTKFESSTNYSLLTPEKEENLPGTEGGRVTNGEEEYCLLDRGGRKTKTITRQQREQLDGYSRLFSN